MLAAETPDLIDALLLFSYPLHPPGRPERLRTEHFSRLRLPCVFVHGSVDPFGSLVELRAAVSLLPVAAEIIPVKGAGHDLKRGRFDLAPIVLAATARIIGGVGADAPSLDHHARGCVATVAMALLADPYRRFSVMAELYGPLRGVKVVACSTAQAGTVPYMLMADLGAEVIKIEVPGIGDNSRGSTVVMPGFPRALISRRTTAG